MDALASKQLAALSRTGERLDEAHVEHWLFGGWAVDFHAGKITRPHSDLDLAVWLDDAPRIAELMTADGWVHAPHEDEDGGTGYELDGVRLEVTYLVRDAEGRIAVALRDGPVAWPEGSFPGGVGELHGVRVRVVGRV